MAKRLPLIVLAVIGFGLLMVIELRPWRTESQTLERAASAPSLVLSETEKMKGEPSTSPAIVPSNFALESAPIRAQLSPVNFTTLTGELNAKIQSIPKREGETFHSGEVLVVYDCTAQRASLEKNRALMAIAKRNYETNKKLLALGSVSQVEHDNSRSEFEKTEAEANELAAVISRCQTLAPFPGRVVEQKVRSQQFVQPGQPVLDIMDDRSMEIEFIAPSRWASWLKVGYGFQVEIDETGRSYPARVTRVAARIDSISQTFKVVAVINGTFKELSAGMSGTLLIKEPDKS